MTLARTMESCDILTTRKFPFSYGKTANLVFIVTYSLIIWNMLTRTLHDGSLTPLSSHLSVLTVSERLASSEIRLAISPLIKKVSFLLTDFSSCQSQLLTTLIRRLEVNFLRLLRSPVDVFLFFIYLFIFYFFYFFVFSSSSSLATCSCN